MRQLFLNYLFKYPIKGNLLKMQTHKADCLFQRAHNITKKCNKFKSIAFSLFAQLVLIVQIIPYFFQFLAYTQQPIHDRNNL